ncbi:uncharacterized protein PHACADRAFT_128701 [Phanerochaete carnosa HHB-10118-sp]|uniref:Uncharacterized protein n=1 Tax=Phanerochaete carnosa (strain HHB-10118-sp) TaxID=650164 RepID=K5VW30_PHACS|nr:uncharacterized protein PHACADRAFT_128701 [Phanerochaete carnosa HHB-10118-sp]EKM51025.1 hypothetical protein PHACADRAFT_128701 [Phanerochaete carnosa HHB-10118-sp]
MPPQKPYEGPSRKLVLAFDVGTTYSGVAYATLDPGETPKIQAVTRFPGQSNSDFKIPSVLLYTQDGQVRAVGAEAKDPRMEMAIEDEDLILVEWFKLHLVPSSMESSIGLKDLDVQHKLPPGKTIVEVFADFLSYMYKCARDYIMEASPNGTSLWNSVQDRIEIVLGHPNGWEGLQQEKMREAAILAGLVPDNHIGQSRVHFVSEGEASLHYCVDMGMTKDFEDGTSAIVIDAGGGTVDLSTYCFRNMSPISVEETAPAECVLQGSTRVNVRAAELLRSKLANTKFSNELDIKAMLDTFEKTAKPNFKDSAEESFVKFGSIRDRDPGVGIKNGQLSLEGAEVSKLFEPSIEAIVDAVQKQKEETLEPISFAFLVGGFAASAWLFTKLKEHLSVFDISLSRPDHHANKAVAVGAASFFLEHFVSVRVARWTYGSSCSVEYDDSNPEHRLRQHKTYMMPSAVRVIPEGFKNIVAKGTRLREGEERIESFEREVEDPWGLNHIAMEITCYRGKNKEPHWVDLEPEYFSDLCIVTADTSGVTKVRQFGPLGPYYAQTFKLVLSCGKTETTAHIRWEENGIERRGPAKIVYDDDARIAQ